MSVEVFIDQQTILKRVQEIGAQITTEFQGEEVVIVGVLNGSFMFCADLVRSIDLPLTIEFISASSYGDGTKSSGEVKINLDLKKDIKGKNVVIVEDIIDTGLTLTLLRKKLLERSPKTLKIASLLFKPSRNEHPVPIDYLGFEIEDKFVIGYGLDYAGRYRELPYIGVYHGEN